jgi:hypothetical protein
MVHLQKTKPRLTFVFLEVLSFGKKYVCPCYSFDELIVRTVHDLLFGNLGKKLAQFEHFYQFLCFIFVVFIIEAAFFLYILWASYKEFINFNLI